MNGTIFIAMQRGAVPVQVGVDLTHFFGPCLVFEGVIKLNICEPIMLAS